MSQGAEETRTGGARPPKRHARHLRVPGENTGLEKIGDGRAVWPDFAKATCICLVVLTHVVTKSTDEFGSGSPAEIWGIFVEALQPIRMPLFFAISGYLAAKYVDVSLRITFRRRVATNYYIYALWTTLYSFMFVILPAISASPASIQEYALALVLGYSSIWYLFALAAYFTVTILLRQYVRITIAFAAILSVAAPLIPAYGNTESILQNFFFFAVCAYYPSIIGWSVKVSSGVLAGVTAIFILAAPAQVVLFDSHLPLLWFATSVAGVIAGIRWCVICARGSWSRRWSNIGRKTLGIYLLHLPLLAIVLIYLPHLTPAQTIFYPVFCAALLVSLCLVLYAVLNRGLPWLFALPAFPSRRTARHAKVKRSTNQVLGPSECRNEDVMKGLNK